MTTDPWALRAAFYSIIVKRHAVARSYPGGLEAFERVYQPGKNGALFLVSRMSMDDVEHDLGRLNADGIIPGQDIAVADMLHGPYLECPGLRFEKHGEMLDTRWWVNIEPGYVEPEPPPEPKVATPPQAPASQPQAPASGSGPRRVVFGTGPVHWVYPGGDEDDEDEDLDFNRRLASDHSRPVVARAFPLPPTPVIVDTRDAFGVADTWQEFLCAKRAEKSIQLQVMAYQVLGELPDEWHDDDGELLPEFQDANGDLKLPAAYDGRRVTGFDGEYLLGELTTSRGPVWAGAVAASIRSALKDLEWEPADLGKVVQTLLAIPSAGPLQLQTSPHRHRASLPKAD